MNEIDIASPPRRGSARPIPRAAWVVLGLAIGLVLLGVIAALGARWGLWHFRTGFTMLRWAARGGLLVAGLALVTLYVTRPGTGRRGMFHALTALLLGLLVAGVPWQSRRMGAGLPRIHDITTDLENPPAFVTIAPLRASAPNPIEHPGPDVARAQQEGYPDIRPVILDLPFEEAFERALDAAQTQGWRLEDANERDGRIEGTDRTFWFGFYDDVVIRLTPLGTNRTVVDVRSKSRVGGSDFGVNARRIRKYLDTLGR